MRMKIFFHNNCFDGLASAAVFSNFYRNSISGKAVFHYEGLAHRAGELFLDVRFDGEENAIVDFKYSSDPRLTWWFDHHQSAFLSREDELHFRLDRSGRKFHDPTYSSCTKFIVEMVEKHFTFDSSRLHELIHWADIIDGAQFEDARSAVELHEPAMKLMMVIEGVRDSDRIRSLISEFQEKSLAEIMAIPWVQEAFRPLYERHCRSIEIIRKKAQCCDSTIFFDVSDYDLEGYNKFIPYYLFPQATYCVGVSLSSYRSKISVGSNPWSPHPRTHNLAALCERHGGGGHPVVGAISFAPDELPKARLIAQEIVRELRGAPANSSMS
ncbi:MAG TPA: phosphoesterase [Acidobacteriota bacterium]|nr:phosphoesterase [Acidobacteriota bacterium]